MNIVICGSRTFTDWDRFQLEMNHILEFEDTETITLISGGAKGADTLAKIYANEKKYNFEEYLADWDLYGNRAGYLRNLEMLKIADKVIAFWDGESKGTNHMIKESKRKSIPLIIIPTK